MKKNNGNLLKLAVVVTIIALLFSGVLSINFNSKRKAARQSLETIANTEKREECDTKDTIIGITDDYKKGLFSSFTYLLNPAFAGSVYMECGVESVMTYVFRDYEMNKSGEWEFIVERISVVPPVGEPPKAIQDEPIK